jgi:uncharacterized protein (TIRG00374 family)
MKNRKIVVWVVTALLLLLLFWKLHTAHFNWVGFWRSGRNLQWRLLGAAALVIYSNAIVRALRWAIFLKPVQTPEERLPWWKLVGPQFIGFAGLAVFGRIGELIRPYLLSKRTGLPFSSQIAVVAVERIFDLAAFGFLFAGNLLFSPELQTLPYHERFHQLGYAIAGITLFLILFVFSVRVAGPAVARISGGIVGLASKKAADVVSTKILEFRDGLNTVSSLKDFALLSFLSLFMWSCVALAYILTMRAYPSPVHDLTIAHCLLLMGFSVVGSIVQLPGIGGGAQAMTIGALTTLYGIPTEMAASAGIVVWLVTTMSVILPGLIFAQLEQVSLRSVARVSEDAEHSETRLVH